MVAVLTYAARGALGFGLGGLILVAGFLEPPRPKPEDPSFEEWRRAASRGPSAGAYLLLLGLPFICGAVGASVLTWGSARGGRGVTGFGCGFIPGVVMILFTHITLQAGGQPVYGWGALGCGIGFGLAGAIGGLSIAPRLLIPGALSFGVAGALYGTYSFWTAPYGYHNLPLGYLGLLLPFVLGGALFGAAYGWACRDD